MHSIELVHHSENDVREQRTPSKQKIVYVLFLREAENTVDSIIIELKFDEILYLEIS